MSEIRHRDRILEAIDQLRKRKARPDVNRICSYMFRRFAVSCIETKLDLQKLVDAEIVIKVDYKGNTSYRNAAKWAMLSSYKYKKELDTSSLLSSAVAELIVLEPDYLDIGVPVYELESHMIQKDCKRFSKKNLEVILKRELELGTLVKLENGNYFIGKTNNRSTMDQPLTSVVGNTVKINRTKSNAGPKPNQQPKKSSKVMPKSGSVDIKMKQDEQIVVTTSESSNVGFRVGVRQKRARIVFDPSDHNLPTRMSRKRGPGRPVGSVNKLQSSSQLSSPNKSSNSNSNCTAMSPTPVPGNTTVVNNHVKSNSTLAVASIPNQPINPGVCSICHSYGIRIKGVPERLISCSDCTTRAHPSCLENGKEGPIRGRNGLWQCVHCKTCTVCEETAEVGSLVVCNGCCDAYHYQCHTPTVPEKYRNGQIKWFCCNCQTETDKFPNVKETNVSLNFSSSPKKDHSSTVVSYTSPPASCEQNDVKPILEEDGLKPIKFLQDPYEGFPIEDSIPDASCWTAGQVYEYFATYFQPDLARVFKDQDIDGQSLLLMKRNDVLAGLNLKLGPALKIYGHVKKLQVRRSNPRLLFT